jgi:hypothetical protein
MRLESRKSANLYWLWQLLRVVRHQILPRVRLHVTVDARSFRGGSIGGVVANPSVLIKLKNRARLGTYSTGWFITASWKCGSPKEL